MMKTLSTRLARNAVLVWGLAFLLVSWWAAPPAGRVGFPLDDAWIHMVYGRQMAEDGYLAYNVGTPATGATSPLWAVWLAVLHGLLGAGNAQSLVVATFVSNALLHIVTLWGALRLARACGARELAAQAAAACLAAAPLLVESVFSGMEVTLTACLLVLGHERLLAQRWTSAGILVGLSCAARPEAAACLPAAILVLVASATEGQSSRRSVVAALARFCAPCALLGAAILDYNLWASDRLFPATYYFKQALSFGDLPARFWTATSRLLPSVAPFAWGVIWLGLLGFLRPVVSLAREWSPSGARELVRATAALLGGASFLVGNLMVIAPVDPAAYYHQRYVLPAVPLLTIGLIVGFDRLRWGSQRWQRYLPVAALAAFSLLVGGFTLKRTAEHFQSDVRNINEVQRALGEWLRENTTSSDWVASVDAGAIRYFSQRNVVDIMGLNTPELYWDAPRYSDAHPVKAIALLPAWFPNIKGSAVRLVHQVHTRPYTVTSMATMARQVVLGCTEGATREPYVALIGMRRVLLRCQP